MRSTCGELRFVFFCPRGAKHFSGCAMRSSFDRCAVHLGGRRFCIPRPQNSSKDVDDDGLLTDLADSIVGHIAFPAFTQHAEVMLLQLFRCLGWKAGLLLILPSWKQTRRYFLRCPHVMFTESFINTGNRDNLLLFLRRGTFIVRSLFLAWTLTRCNTTWPTTSTRCATASTVARRALSARRPSASLTKERMGLTADGGTPCTAPDPNRGKSPSLRCLQPGVHDVNVEQDMAQYGVRSCVSWRRVRAHALGGGVRGGASQAPVTTCDCAARLARKPHTERQ